MFVLLFLKGLGRLGAPFWRLFRHFEHPWAPLGSLWALFGQLWAPGWRRRLNLGVWPAKLPAKSVFRHSGLEAPKKLSFGGVLETLGLPFLVFLCFLSVYVLSVFSESSSRPRPARAGPG